MTKETSWPPHHSELHGHEESRGWAEGIAPPMHGSENRKTTKEIGKS